MSDVFKTALVTGASSGIGRAVAESLLARGLAVHATARRAERLAEIAGAVPHALDLLDRDAIYRAFEGLEIDVLVANAGTARGYDGLVDASPDDLDATFGANLGGFAHTVRAVLPGMIARGRGHIVAIGSVTGIYPTGSAVYGASKGAVRLFCQNLRLELRGTGVRTTEICPGRVATEIYDAAFDDPALTARYKATGIRELQPADVAEAVLYALDQPSRVNVATIEITPVEQSYGGAHFAPVEKLPDEA